MEQRERIIQDLLGTRVHVEVDRPVGYLHGDILYPVNYGYIPGVIAGDGEAQDAYILGISEPLSSFDGRVIAAIRRRNDVEDKLVVAPEGMVFHQGQIGEAVRFQEQYFDSTVDSLFRKSCGVIPFRVKGDKLELLLLLQTNRCWSFPKGHMDAGETEEQTALRELFEETGLTAKLRMEHPVVLEYSFGSKYRKQVVLFPGEVTGHITPQASEILGYRWASEDTLQNFLHPDTCAACAHLPALLRSCNTNEVPR